jgi:hypothetical protein
MKFGLFALLLLLLQSPTAAYAQEPQVNRLDVVEYGIYTATTTGYSAAPGTASGRLQSIANVSHTETTLTIPAQPGVRFGFRYTVVGSPTGAVVPLHFVTIFPKPGLLNPETQQLKSQNDYDGEVRIGDINAKLYILNHDWELAPGVWTFQIWDKSRKLAEQSFTVVRP